MVKALTPRTNGRGMLEVDVQPAGVNTPENITGAYVLDVDGHVGAAAELTLTGDASLSFTGWVANTSDLQEILVTVKQDATGGHVFDWFGVAGSWDKAPNSGLPTAANVDVLTFRAWTIDGGTTVYLTAEDSAFTDADGDEWQYRVDTNGNLHRWYASQPPVAVVSGASTDIRSGAAVQVPQVDFYYEVLVKLPDYSDGNQGLGGQLVLVGNLFGWALALNQFAQVKVTVAEDNTATQNQTTAADLYSTGVADGSVARIRVTFRHLGASIDVDVHAMRPREALVGLTDAPALGLIETLNFPIANLHNQLIHLHLGSEARSASTSDTGLTCMNGTLLSAELAIGGAVQARFPNPVGAETWVSYGTDLAAPAPFIDDGEYPKSKECTVVGGNGTMGTALGSYTYGCSVETLPVSGDPEDSFPAAGFPLRWVQGFTGGIGGTETYVIEQTAGGVKQWRQWS